MNEVELPMEAVMALTQGKRVDAIKSVRVSQNLGLKESKDLVDRFLSTHPDLNQIVRQAEKEALQKIKKLLIGLFLVMVGTICFYWYQHR